MDEQYFKIFGRNIGLISSEMQKRLKHSKVVVFGVGGLGGVIAEVLVRSGIGSIVLVDYDRFETSNLNRQIFAFTDTVGQYKIDVAENFLRKINPAIQIEKYLQVNSSNVSDIMNMADLAILALDDAVPVVTISRYAREKNIPLVEGWAIPFGNVRVFTQNTPSLEDTYHFNLEGKNPEDLTQEEKKLLNLNMLLELKKIKGIEEFYPEQAMQNIKEGRIPSFAPMVWFTAIIMSFEAIKLLLNWGTIAFAPDYVLYDPFSHSLEQK